MRKLDKLVVVECVRMEDPYPVPPGTRGRIEFIDDLGQIHVKWDNGSSLALVEGVDEFKIVYTEGLENVERIKKYLQYP